MISVAISRIDDNVIHVDGSVDPIRDIEVRPPMPGLLIYFQTVAVCEVSRGEKMALRGTDPESYITEHTSVCEDIREALEDECGYREALHDECGHRGSMTT